MTDKWDKLDTLIVISSALVYLGFLLSYHYGFKTIGGILFLIGVFSMIWDILLIIEFRKGDRKWKKQEKV